MIAFIASITVTYISNETNSLLTTNVGQN